MSEKISPPQRNLPQCQWPSCNRDGLYPAPKSRADLGRIWLCLEHVRLYNAQWNYLAGYSPEQIEAHIRESTVWERPTWPFGKGPLAQKKAKTPKKPPVLLPTIRKALEVLEIDPPATWTQIKTQHRKLVKKHHPDTSRSARGDADAFLGVQQAFATLKKYYAAQSKPKAQD